MRAGDVRTQEEMLRKTQGLAEKADYSALKTHILPRTQRLCLATTSAAVRSEAFAALTALAPRFDKEVATGLVGTLQQVSVCPLAVRRFLSWHPAVTLIEAR